MANDPLPELQISPESLQEYRDFYTELIGFVPPRIQARTDLLGRLDPELLRMQEELRARAMYPACFDVKTSQLMLFGILLGLLSDATRLHAIAARAGRGDLGGDERGRQPRLSLPWPPRRQPRRADHPGDCREREGRRVRSSGFGVRGDYLEPRTELRTTVMDQFHTKR